MTRLILYNIEYLEGIRGKKREYLKFWKRFVHPKNFKAQLSRELKKYEPDILSLVEVGGPSFLEENYFLYLKKALDMRYHIKRVKYQLGQMNWARLIPFFRDQSNGIMSKKKIFGSEVLYLKEGFKRAVIKVDFHLPNKISLLLVHLALGKKTRKRQIDELARIVKRVGNPVILAGDFNTFGGEKEINRLLEEAALEHRFKIHGGRVFTYPTFHPRKRFDYILTSKGIKVKEYKVLKLGFSDHLPVMIDFEVKNERAGDR